MYVIIIQSLKILNIIANFIVFNFLDLDNLIIFQIKSYSELVDFIVGH